MLIKDEKDLLDIMVSDFQNVTVNKYYVKTLFYESLNKQRELGKLLKTTFNSLINNPQHRPYSNKYILRPWPASKVYKSLTHLFTYQPSSNLELVIYLSQLFIPILIETWPYVIAANSDLVKLNYYSTGMPGTSVEAREKARKQLVDHIKQLRKTFGNLETGIEKRYKGLQASKVWRRYKTALFPVGYQLGVAGYGRLSSIPGTTLSNNKKTYKARVLNTIGRQSGLRFFEIDLKGCHLSIFRELYDFKNKEDDKSLLPPQDNVWPTLLTQFKLIHTKLVQELEIPNWIIAKVDQWLNLEKSPMIGLLKNQTYKCLNGGNPHECFDNVKKSKTKLNITDHQINPISKYLGSIFSQIGMFNLLIKFNSQISAKPYLYLPNAKNPFRTHTLSRNQAQIVNQNFAKFSEMGHFIQGNTSNSRLFRSMEFCLILHVFESIVQAELDWLVVSYEQDGLLIAAEQNVTNLELFNDLELLNNYLINNIKCLTYASHILEIKML